jgi:hypothetical protein
LSPFRLKTCGRPEGYFSAPKKITFLDYERQILPHPKTLGNYAKNELSQIIVVFSYSFRSIFATKIRKRREEKRREEKNKTGKIRFGQTAGLFFIPCGFRNIKLN